MGGSKGVLVKALDNDGEFSLKSSKIVLRPSMTKFTSTDRTLCLVNKNRYFPMTLNKEAINLLVSINLDNPMSRVENYLTLLPQYHPAT